MTAAILLLAAVFQCGDEMPEQLPEKPLETPNGHDAAYRGPAKQQRDEKQNGAACCNGRRISKIDSHDRFVASDP